MRKDIYEYIEEQFNRKIDDYQFKRDYIKKPLTKSLIVNHKASWEIPYKEDLEYLFYNLKLQKKDVAGILSIDFVKLGRIMREMNIHIVRLSTKQIPTLDFYDKFDIDVNQMKRDYLKNPLHLVRGDSSNEKPYKEDLEYLLNKGIFLDDIGQYFGVKCTCIIKWMKKYELRTKIRPISGRKDNNAKELLSKYKIDISRLSRDYIKIPLKVTPNRSAIGYTIEMPSKEDLEYLFIELNMGRREISQYFNVSEPQIKIWNKKYNIRKTQDLIQKNVIKTRIELGKPFDSIDEKKIYEKLLNIYDKDDILFHYWSEEYPFNCDFYIKSKKLYIEYQGYGGGHNNRPYLNTDEDKMELNYHKELAENGHTMSQRIVRTWYMKDPIKRNWANEHNLNWIEFFNMNQFLDWFNIQKIK